MLDCIGMNRFTSPNKTPITINVMTTWTSGISYSPFGSLTLIEIRKNLDQLGPDFLLIRYFSLLVVAQVGDCGCATCIGNRLHEAQGGFRWGHLA